MFDDFINWKQRCFLQDVCHCVLQLVAQPTLLRYFHTYCIFFNEEVTGFEIQLLLSLVIYKWADPVTQPAYFPTEL